LKDISLTLMMEQSCYVFIELWHLMATAKFVTVAILAYPVTKR